jgi:prepilin-type N-terminal cleavage/methylation domain-containing protein
MPGRNAGVCAGARRIAAATWNGRRGFTLAEIMIVVAIMSIVAAFAFPRFHDFQTAAESRAAARSIVLTLKGAQQRAAMLNRPVMAFFPDTVHVALYADLDLDGSPDLPGEATAIRVPGQTWWSGYPTYELPGRRSFTVAGFPIGNLGYPQFTLRSDGTVTSGGSLTLRDSRGTTYLLNVTPTGAVSLSRQDGA